MATKREYSGRPTVGKGSGGAAPSQVVKDPNISFGRFKVLAMTTGAYAVYDPERPFGDRTVSIHKEKQEASDAAKARDESEAGACTSVETASTSPSGPR